MKPLVILVEDNESDEKLTVLAFESCGVEHDLKVLRDGVEALDYLLDPRADPLGRKPALILLDLKLPRVDGVGVLSRLRENERTRRLPVVMLTASGEHGDIARCYALGASAYVQKPVEYEEFAQVIQSLGRFWLRWNQAAPDGFGT